MACPASIIRSPLYFHLLNIFCLVGFTRNSSLLVICLLFPGVLTNGSLSKSFQDWSPDSAVRWWQAVPTPCEGRRSLVVRGAWIPLVSIRSQGFEPNKYRLGLWTGVVWNWIRKPPPYPKPPLSLYLGVSMTQKNWGHYPK